MFGFYCINKPAGPTSHDIVSQMRRRLPRKTKTGHAGTLDPFATGVLVICVGPATRLAQYVQDTSKRYLAEITLGATSDTCDSTGIVTPWDEKVNPPSEENIKKLLAESFTGLITQVPPAHSAIHINGQRAYELARKGIEVDIPSRQVNIHEISLVSYDFPKLVIDVKCSCGTYIRSLARDIGSALNVGGYCSELERTAVGTFDISSAKTVDEIDIEADIIAPGSKIELEKIVISSELIEPLQQGKLIPTDFPMTPATEYAIVNGEGSLLAIATPVEDTNTLQPRKVFIR